MNITLDKIRSLSPCQDRLNNFLKYYPNFSGDLERFLKLKNISYTDKAFVFMHLFTKEQHVMFAKKVIEFTPNIYVEDTIFHKILNEKLLSVKEMSILSKIDSLLFIDVTKEQKELNLKLMLECIKI